MSLISILKRSIRTAAAGLVFVGLVSPANATYQHEPVEVFPDLPTSATADHASAVPTSHLACSGRPSATASSRRSPIRGRVGLGAPATAIRPGAGPQADYLSRVLTRCAATIPGGNNL